MGESIARDAGIVVEAPDLVMNMTVGRMTYAGAGVDIVVEMAKRAYLWTTGMRAVQGQFAQVTVGEDVIDPVIYDALHQGNRDPPLSHRLTSFERKDLVKYLLWLMTHYVVLLEDGVRLQDGRIVSEQTYLLSIKELLQPDPNAKSTTC